MSAPVGIVGGGSFGIGLGAAIARQGGQPLLWSRKPLGAKRSDGTATPAEARSAGEGVGVPERSGATHVVEQPSIRKASRIEELGECELVFVVVPSMYVPQVAPQLASALDGRHLLVHVSRGLIGEDLETVSRHLSAHTPARRVGCLAGPINAAVLERGVPGGGVVGSLFPEVAEAVRQAIGGATLRLYPTDDTAGVEVASAMVGLLALVLGFGLESKISPSALAVMMSRGLAEAARVGVRLGARAETFSGLAGAGDLFAAMAGDERAELRLGRALARSMDLEAAGREAGAHIEGLTIARRVANYAARVGVEAPIASVIADVLEGSLTPERALRNLMAR